MRRALLVLAAITLTSTAAQAKTYTLDSKGNCHDEKGQMSKKPLCAAPAPAPAMKPAPTAAPSMKASPAMTAASPQKGAPVGATALCKDGTYSMSKTHSGSCSSHKGVQQFFN